MDPPVTPLRGGQKLRTISNSSLFASLRQHPFATPSRRPYNSSSGFHWDTTLTTVKGLSEEGTRALQSLISTPLQTIELLTWAIGQYNVGEAVDENRISDILLEAIGLTVTLAIIPERTNI
jgi:hypothetical protein